MNGWTLNFRNMCPLMSEYSFPQQLSPGESFDLEEEEDAAAAATVIRDPAASNKKEKVETISRQVAHIDALQPFFWDPRCHGRNLVLGNFRHGFVSIGCFFYLRDFPSGELQPIKINITANQLPKFLLFHHHHGQGEGMTDTSSSSSCRYFGARSQQGIERGGVEPDTTFGESLTKMK